MRRDWCIKRIGIEIKIHLLEITTRYTSFSAQEIGSVLVKRFLFEYPLVFEYFNLGGHLYVMPCVKIAKSVEL